MSATLQQGLASLLVRRTEEGRAEARRRIDAWQKAIEAVRQAERIAEYKINLSIEQVQGVQQAAAQLDTANYVLAVYLANKAINKRNAVIATATNALQQHISECYQAEVRAKQDLQEADTQRTVTINQAKASRAKVESNIISNNRENGVMSVWNYEQIHANSPSVIKSIIPIIIPCVFYFVLSFMLDIARVGDTSVVRSGLVILVVITILFRLRPLKNILTFNRDWRAAIVEEQSVIRAADATFQQATSTADQQFLERQSTLENNIKSTEVRRKKAEGALQWLKAQS